MKAYELIDKPEKWFGSNTPDTTGRLCLGLAIGDYRTGYTQEEKGMHWKRVKDRLNSTDTFSPVQWNDAPERTWQEVYDLLKELDI